MEEESWKWETQIVGILNYALTFLLTATAQWFRGGSRGGPILNSGHPGGGIPARPAASPPGEEAAPFPRGGVPVPGRACGGRLLTLLAS